MSKVNLSTISNQQGTRTVDVEDLIDNQQRIHVNNREVVRRLAAEAGLTLVAGSFEEGATVNLKTEVVWQQATGKVFAWFQDAVKTVAAGATPATSGGIGTGAWVDRTDVTLRGELSSSGGALMVSDGSATQSELNANDIRKFGADVSPADSTAAFVAAYAAAKNVYVPQGEFSTSVFYPDRTFGNGKVFVVNGVDYTDNGERPIHSSIPRDNHGYDKARTFGNFERGAGKSLIVNSDDRPQVSGFSSDSDLASYPSIDSVGYFISMSGPRDQVTTTAASTVYTATTVTAPEISSVNAEKIKLGSFIKTGHSPNYRARINAVDLDTNTITVNGWFPAGNSASGQVPPSGIFCILNAVDKIWGQNTVCYLNSQSNVATATGYELGFLLEKNNVPVWGFHAVNSASSAVAGDIAFNATGNWNVGFQTSRNITGFASNFPTSRGFYCRNENASWSGPAFEYNTSVATGYLSKVILNGSVIYSEDYLGRRNAQRESVQIISASTSIGVHTSNVILYNNTSDITITLPPATGVAGQILEHKAAGTGKVTLSNGLTIGGATGYSYIRQISDGSSWQTLLRAA